MTFSPDDPNAPGGESDECGRARLSNSTFTYDGRPINNIDVQARGRVNQDASRDSGADTEVAGCEARLKASWTTGARFVTR
jgi:hypothetical protein